MKPAILFVLLAASTQAASWRTIRRATLAVACSASAADALTTQGHRYELNPLLRRADGRPAMGRIWSVKLATCGALAFSQERWQHDRVWSGVNIGTAGALGYVAFRNSRR